jgi:hypothetical protein
MPAEVKMTINERRKYLLRMRLRYVQANRRERSRLLDEMVQVTELHRKSLIRLMTAEPMRRPRQRQRGRTYSHEVDDAAIRESPRHRREPGLHLCGTTDAQLAANGEAADDAW